MDLEAIMNRKAPNAKKRPASCTLPSGSKKRPAAKQAAVRSAAPEPQPLDTDDGDLLNPMILS